MKTGVIYLKIRMELAQDVSPEQAKELVSELDYQIADETNLIENVEIVEASTNVDMTDDIEVNRSY